jgi:hypothetical protein
VKKIKDQYPQLYSFSKNQEIAIEEDCNIASSDIYDHFHLAMSMVAAQQLNDRKEQILPLIDPSGKDK